MFADRVDAGRALALKLAEYAGSDAIVYGLPRGGVITAKTVADELGLPLGVIVARKLGHPHNPEYAIGAISEDGEIALNEAEAAQAPRDWLADEMRRQLEEARRRRELFGGELTVSAAAGRTAIVVDDGIATGYTMRAALMSLHKVLPRKLIAAAPVASGHTVELLACLADAVVVVEAQDALYAIGQYYRDFRAVEDDEVIAALREHSLR